MYIYKYVVANNCCMSDTSTAVINNICSYIYYICVFGDVIMYVHNYIRRFNDTIICM